MDTPLNSPEISSVRSDFLIAKIVSNPSETSWSQAYNAGNLFAVLSLQKEPQEETTEKTVKTESLNAIGKKILDTLEQNFFTTENKNLQSIKQAATEAAKTIPSDIESSFVVASFVKNILYVFANDKGKVFLKRGEKFGVILESFELEPKTIVSSSGFIENYDFVVLGTKNFFNIVDPQTLSSHLDNREPAEIAEILTPSIHEKEESKAAAIIIQYEKIEEPKIPYAEEEGVQEEVTPSADSASLEQVPQVGGSKIAFVADFFSFLKRKINPPSGGLKLKINHSKKIYLTIAVIILVVLFSSIFFAIKKQNDAKTKALFDSIYTQAQKSYDEGASLLDLNKSLARDSLSTAQKILADGQTKFSKNSKEEKQIFDLLQKVREGLAQVSPIDKSGLDRSKLSITVENGSGAEGAAGKAADILKAAGYNSPSTGNADNFNYQGVTIKVKSDKKDFLDLLKKDLSKDYAISFTSSDLPSSSSTDALIIIGK